jgi:hypothetical protein
VGCIVAVIGLAVPRFALAVLWVFSDRLDRAFDSFVVGFIGFLLLPTTTLMWAIAHHPAHGVRGFGWILVGIGLAFDLSTHGASGQRLRDRAGR